jgi:hypothetical protein
VSYKCIDGGLLVRTKSRERLILDRFCRVICLDDLEPTPGLGRDRFRLRTNAPRE